VQGRRCREGDARKELQALNAMRGNFAIRHHRTLDRDEYAWISPNYHAQGSNNP
jgi:hypothetical protein